MKNVKLFSMALAALMLGACSSDEVAVNDGQQGPDWNTSGKGYINLAIQLPTQPNTRAWEDGSNFDDGTPAEYEVNNATLILFAGEEGSEVVNSAYAMDLNFSSEDPANNQITTSAKITQEINSISATSIKALVVLNNNGIIKVGEGAQLQDAAGTDLTGKTIADLNTALKSASATANWHADGWLMSNAVMATAQGGTVTPTNANVSGPLVGIDASKIYKTKGEADANPAATIYVERAEGKVTLTADAGTTTDGSNLAYTINGWALDNTSKKNYLVRDVTSFATWKGYSSQYVSPADYRMIGNASIATGLYRVYWAEDANYSGVLTPANEYTTVGGAHATIDAGLLAADGEAAGYCFENTTDLTNMTEQNLTRVIVKATFNGGTAFYTVDGDRSEVWTEANVKTEAAARLVAVPEINAWIEANLTAGQTFNSATDLEITLSNEAAGARTITAVALSEAGEAKFADGTVFYGDDNAEAVTIANDHITLDYYAGGAAYYPVYIAHFGQTQTPWTAEQQSGTEIYGNNPSDYLGRWAVVRNNWYDVSVTGIKSLGAPNVEEVTNEPVDKKESYISVAINVLSWAKRTQSVEL